MVCIVLDEFPSPLIPEGISVHGIVFKRPHTGQRRGQTCSVRGTPPPAFLFPNQRCQRPDRLAGPTVLRPVAARSGVSSRPRFQCQPALLNSFDRVGRGSSERKSRPGPPRSFPLQSGTIRLRLGTLAAEVLNCKSVSALSRFNPCPVPSEGRRISPPFWARNPFGEILRQRLWRTLEDPCPRRRGQLSQPQDDGGEGDDGEIVSGGLFEAGCDAAELFELGEAALDQVTLGVEVLV